jgi:hypothetical protein
MAVCATPSAVVSSSPAAGRVEPWHPLPVHVENVVETSLQKSMVGGIGGAVDVAFVT